MKLEIFSLEPKTYPSEDVFAFYKKDGIYCGLIGKVSKARSSNTFAVSNDKTVLRNVTHYIKIPIQDTAILNTLL